MLWFKVGAGFISKNKFTLRLSTSGALVIFSPTPALGALAVCSLLSCRVGVI